MKPIIQIIEQYGIPTHSHIRAGMHLVRDEYNQPIPDQSKEFYELKVSELLDETIVFDNQRIAKFTFMYFIQEYVKLHNSSEPMPPVESIYNQSHQKAVDFIKHNQYHWAVSEDDDSKFDDSGQLKKKKGAKKELAQQIWLDNPDLNKEEIIKLLIKEAGLTDRGALTYYYNLRKKFG